MKVAVYGSRRQFDVLPYISRFLDTLRGNGAQIYMHSKLYDHLRECQLDLKDIERCGGDLYVDIDLAVSIGGDGTFLRTVLWLGRPNVPIAGVNAGHLGYLTALSVEQLPDLPDLIRNDAFRIEHRRMLSVAAPELPQSVGYYALNEVALSKEESASMIHARVMLDDTLLADYSADGLIVSTSTGSTAYNLSVGGPIVDPSLNVRVISPVAAHSLSMRPVVVGDHNRITIIPSGRSPHVRLALDGRSTLINTGTPIVIDPEGPLLAVLQLRDQTFADILRRKLHWGEN